MSGVPLLCTVGYLRIITVKPGVIHEDVNQLIDYSIVIISGNMLGFITYPFIDHPLTLLLMDGFESRRTYTQCKDHFPDICLKGLFHIKPSGLGYQKLDHSLFGIINFNRRKRISPVDLA